MFALNLLFSTVVGPFPKINWCLLYNQGLSCLLVLLAGNFGLPGPAPPFLWNETIHRGSGPTSSGLSLPISFQVCKADIHKCTQRERTSKQTQWGGQGIPHAQLDMLGISLVICSRAGKASIYLFPTQKNKLNCSIKVNGRVAVKQSMRGNQDCI